MTDIQEFLKQGGDAIRNQLTHVTDPGYLRAVVRAEKAGKQRGKVIEKAESRLRVLSENATPAEVPAPEAPTPEVHEAPLSGSELPESSSEVEASETEASEVAPVVEEQAPASEPPEAPTAVETSPGDAPTPSPKPKRSRAKLDTSQPAPWVGETRRARRKESGARRPRTGGGASEMENGVVVRGTCCVCGRRAEGHEEVTKVFGLRSVPRAEGRVMRRQPQCKKCRGPAKV